MAVPKGQKENRKEIGRTEREQNAIDARSSLVISAFAFVPHRFLHFCSVINKKELTISSEIFANEVVSFTEELFWNAKIRDYYYLTCFYLQL